MTGERIPLVAPAERPHQDQYTPLGVFSLSEEGKTDHVKEIPKMKVQLVRARVKATAVAEIETAGQRLFAALLPRAVAGHSVRDLPPPRRSDLCKTDSH